MLAPTAATWRCSALTILAVKHALERDFKRMEEIRQQAGNEAG